MAWQNTPVGDYRSKRGTVNDRPRLSACVLLGLIERAVRCASIGNAGPKAGSAVTRICSEEKIAREYLSPTQEQSMAIARYDV